MTVRANENFGYGYDGAGNLLWRTNNTLIQEFAADNANELVNVSRNNNLLTFEGSLTNAVDSLTVNGQAAAVYNDLTFGAFVPMTQGSHTVNDTATATITGQNSSGATSFSSQFTVNNINPAHRAVTYDNHSVRLNLTQDHQNIYQYDPLGQITGIDGRSYQNDGLGRLISYKETDGSTTKLVYSGHRVIQEINGTKTVNYTINGQTLLARTDNAGTAFYHQDANGNVVDMTDGNGAVVATYLYEPYGQLIAAWGKLSQTNLYRFSSERFDVGASLYYYGYRFYSPELRKWPNQDPIGEQGGLNLYGFVGNDPINRVDALGLAQGYGNGVYGAGGTYIGPSSFYSASIVGPNGQFYPETMPEMGPGAFFTIRPNFGPGVDALTAIAQPWTYPPLPNWPPGDPHWYNDGPIHDLSADYAQVYLAVTGVGGAGKFAKSLFVKCPLTANRISQINQGFGGTTALTGDPATVIANMAYREGDAAKAATAIRDIAGRHLFDDANKRTAQAVAEQIFGNNANSAQIRAVIDQVATGQLRTVEEIEAALLGKH